MKRMTGDRLTAILMISPSLILLAVFVYGFIGQTFYNSLTDWGVGTNSALSSDLTLKFIGTKNYQDLFSGLLNITFRYDLVNNILFTILFLLACLFLGLFMAILLDQGIRGEGIFRTIFLFPMSLSFVVTGTVWRWLYQPNGGLNVLPTIVGLPPLANQWFISRDKLATFTWGGAFLIVAGLIFLLGLLIAYFTWRSGRRGGAVVLLILFSLVSGFFLAAASGLPSSAINEKHGFNVAVIAIVIAAAWQMSGYTMAIYLAGLRGIPEELREAARVDGCTEWGVYRHIIFPLLSPITLSAAIILGHISLKIFDLVYVMAGANNSQVGVPGVYMYVQTFQGNHFALGSAVAIIMLLLVAAIIIPYLRSALQTKT
jgi:glucose/mannose transport system permease protein